MYLRTVLGALALTALAAAKVHIIKVAPGGQLEFSPNTIKAEKGDQIQFDFESDGHSVAQGDFDNGCQPSDDDDAFFSGFPNTGQWTITLDDDTPHAIYCATPGHCEAGMVGVINPSGDNTLEAYQKAAGGASGSKTPAKVQGGVFKAASGSGSGGGGGGGGGSSTSGGSYSNGAGGLVLKSLAAMVPLAVTGFMLL